MSNTPENQPPASEKAPDPVKNAKTQWNLADDTALLAELALQKAAGYQTDNGGFHQDAYKSAASKMPNPGHRGLHKTAEACKSRYSTVSSVIFSLVDMTSVTHSDQMKKDYQDVKFIRERSGFGWDAERSIATATDDVWEKLFEVYI